MVRQHGFLGGGRTDQILPPGLPGYKPFTMYPDTPDVAKAKELMGGRTAMLPLLLDGGADINARGRNGQTALWHVVCRHDLPTAQMLLERGADPELADSFGKPP